MSEDHELLLEWVSELGSGTWDQFKRANEWLFHSGDAKTTRTAGRNASSLSVLGHMEIDWVADRWAAAPPVLTVLPSAGAHATLVGSRTRYLKRRLDDCEADVYVSVHPQLSSPDAIFIAASDEHDVIEVARFLAVHYEFSVADRLSRLFPSFDSYLSVAREAVPTRGFGVSRFSTHALAWAEVEADRLPGLYKYEAYGRPEYRYVDADGAGYLEVDLPLGIYAELRRMKQDVLHFREDEVNGTLVVPGMAPLPWMQARSASLCSGLEPWLNRNSWTREYVNVPQVIAERIADSLDQQLAVEQLARHADEGRPDVRRRIPHIRFSQ